MFETGADVWRGRHSSTFMTLSAAAGAKGATLVAGVQIVTQAQGSEFT